MEPKSPSKVKFSIMGFTRYRKILRILIASSLVIFLLLAGGYFAFKWKKAHYFVERDHYTVVVDFGSTGTRVNVYKWKIRSLEDWDLPILENSYPKNSNESLFSRSSCKYHCMQTEPGLDKFVGNSTGVRLSLEPLILRAEKWVPFEKHGDTPIFVLATAGLRSLPTEDARRVLDDVEHVLMNHSFVYRRRWIRVLSGKEEAYYGWVALNYKMGILGNSSERSTLGLLDLGGSSLQIVMEVHDGARDDIQLIRSKIGLVEHQILAYSLPSLGLNEAFDRTVAMLSQLQLTEGSIDDRFKIRHPCLGLDSKQNYLCHACDGQNITYQKNLSGNINKNEYTYFVGDPDWERCKGIARVAAINSSSLDLSQPQVHTNCKASLPFYSGGNILNLKSGTFPTGRFHALSGFYAVYNILNLAPKANFSKIWEKGEQLCSKSSGDLSNLSGNPNYFAQYCFKVPYVASLIEDALCLGDLEIIFGPGDISWTLGAALIEGEWLSVSKTSISPLRGLEVIYSPVFVFLLLLCLLLIVHVTQIKLPMLGKKASTVGSSLPSYLRPKQRPN